MSENQAGAETDPTTSAVGCPLVEKPGIIYLRGGDTEVSPIERVKEVDPDLGTYLFGNARIFYDPEIHVLYTVGTQYISTGIPNTLTL